MGAGLSICFVVISLVFTLVKIEILWNKQDVDIMSALDENIIDYSDEFSGDNGFFVAAAITEYDSNPESVEEVRYGELVIEHFGWGYAEEVGVVSSPLKYHSCSDEELGFNRTESTLIYPIRENQIHEVTTYRKKFKCLDKE